MGVPFNQVPQTVRVPFMYAEFSNQGANPGATLLAFLGLMWGQKTNAGTAAANVAISVTSAVQAAVLFGPGSMLHRMALAWFFSNPLTPMQCMPLADAGGGAAATGTFTIGGTATAAGTLANYISGDLVATGVSLNDTAATVATNLAAVIQADTALPVTAAAVGAVVTVTAKNKGVSANDISLILNYYSTDALPAGITCAIVAMSGGTTNPTLTTAIANIAGQWFQIMAFPWTDAGSLTAIEAELTSRSGPLEMIDGVAFMATAASLSGAETLGQSRNNAWTSIMNAFGEPRWTAEVAACVAGVVAQYGNIDPARPFQTLELPWLMGPQVANQYTLAENNSLLFDGISTSYVDSGGVVRIQRLITTYQKNALGVPDTSYLDVNTPLTLMYLRYDFRSYWLNKYPRHKLADDGTRYGQGQPVMTPALAKAEAIARFRVWEDLGLVQDADAFKAALIVVRNAEDVNRLDFMLPPTLINQLMVEGVQFAFLL